MTRKIIAFLLTIVTAVCCCSFVASAAQNNNSRAIADATKHSFLRINGTTASCESVYVDAEKFASLTVTQTLEKHWAFGLFFAVDNASWTYTFYDKSLANFLKYKFSLGSGTYRLRSEFNRVGKDGSTESITVYSLESTVS